MDSCRCWTVQVLHFVKPWSNGGDGRREDLCTYIHHQACQANKHPFGDESSSPYCIASVEILFMFGKVEAPNGSTIRRFHFAEQFLKTFQLLTCQVVNSTAFYPTNSIFIPLMKSEWIVFYIYVMCGWDDCCFLFIVFDLSVLCLCTIRRSIPNFVLCDSRDTHIRLNIYGSWLVVPPYRVSAGTGSSTSTHSMTSEWVALIQNIDQTLMHNIACLTHLYFEIPLAVSVCFLPDHVIVQTKCLWQAARKSQLLTASRG